jgi:hypothetical protein
MAEAIRSASYWLELVRVSSIGLGANKRRQQGTVFFTSDE